MNLLYFYNNILGFTCRKRSSLSWSIRSSLSWSIPSFHDSSETCLKNAFFNL